MKELQEIAAIDFVKKPSAAHLVQQEVSRLSPGETFLASQLFLDLDKKPSNVFPVLNNMQCIRPVTEPKRGRATKWIKTVDPRVNGSVRTVCYGLQNCHYTESGTVGCIVREALYWVEG